MIIKCRTNDGRILPKELGMSGWDDDSNIQSLTTDKNYVVYAISVLKGHTCYLICDNIYSYYPLYYSNLFFEVVENAPSKYWISRQEIDTSDENKTEIEKVGFLAMFNIPYFYGELVEGERQDIIDIFNRYRKMLNIESNNDKIAKALAAKVARFSMEK